MNIEETETKINGTMGNTVKGKEAVIVPPEEQGRDVLLRDADPKGRGCN